MVTGFSSEQDSQVIQSTDGSFYISSTTSGIVQGIDSYTATSEISGGNNQEETPSRLDHMADIAMYELGIIRDALIGEKRQKTRNRFKNTEEANEYFLSLL